jgi:putative nucleotidyltransferase with HDIG domain
LVALIPEFEAAMKHDPHSPDHAMTVDEHIFAVVQAAADAGVPLRVRLGALFHDLGKPLTASFRDHAAAGAEIADAALRRFRYPNDTRERVVELIRIHPFHLEPGQTLTALDARRLLAAHGEGLVLDLLDQWEADLRGRDVTPRSEHRLEEVGRFRAIVNEQVGSPHRLSDLAVDGTDLIALGFEPGPDLGAALAELLREVVEDPTRNTRDALLERAAELRT